MEDQDGEGDVVGQEGGEGREREGITLVGLVSSRFKGQCCSKQNLAPTSILREVCYSHPQSFISGRKTRDI